MADFVAKIVGVLDPLNGDEQNKRYNEKFKTAVMKLPYANTAPAFFASTNGRPAFAAELSVVVKNKPASGSAEHLRGEVTDKRSDNRTERDTDDDRHGEFDNVPRIANFLNSSSMMIASSLSVGVLTSPGSARAKIISDGVHFYTLKSD